MPTFEVAVTIKQDGIVVPGFPILRRVEVDEAQSAAVELASAGNTTSWTAVQAALIDTLNFLFVMTDVAATLRLDDQSDAAGRSTIPLNAGGMLILIDTTIDSGAGSPNARVNNNSGSTAVIRSFVGGT